MSTVTSLSDYREQREEVERFDAYEGLCPVCRKTDGMLNVHKDHFMHCKAHRVYWHIGRNCYSDWMEEGPDVWEANARLLMKFRQVEPFYPGMECDRCGADYSPAGFVRVYPEAPTVSAAGLEQPAAKSRCGECADLVGRYAYSGEKSVCQSCRQPYQPHDKDTGTAELAGCCSACTIELMPGGTAFGWPCGDCGHIQPWSRRPSTWTDSPGRPICEPCRDNWLPF